MELINSNIFPTPLRSRIAPTPSGFLHLGNVFSFVLTWLIVRQNKGHLLLRIDDLDSQRRRIAYLDDIFNTLAWLGLDYDEGASGTEDFLKNFSQGNRLDQYQSLLNELISISHSLVFACICSRNDILQKSAKGLYTGTCRDKKIQFSSPAPHESAWRIEVAEKSIVFEDVLKREINISLAETMGDFVVRRKDGIPAYQIASLSDDLEANINLIVRGEDLLNSSAAQIFLAQVLDKKAFLKTQFLHHPLLYENPKQKMSKSHYSLSIKAIRENLSSPKPIFQWIASQLGLNTKIGSLPDLLADFDISKIKSNLYFSERELLNWEASK